MSKSLVTVIFALSLCFQRMSNPEPKKMLFKKLHQFVKIPQKGAEKKKKKLFNKTNSIFLIQSNFSNILSNASNCADTQEQSIQSNFQKYNCTFEDCR